MDHWAKTGSRRRVVVVFIAALVTLFGLPGLPIELAKAATEPSHVTRLRAEVGALGTWLGQLVPEGPLGTALPLTDRPDIPPPMPGLEILPGTTLDLADTIDATLVDKIDNANIGTPPDSTTGLANIINGLDTTIPTTGGDIGVTFTTSNVVDNSDPVDGFDLAIAITRTINATLALTDPDGAGTTQSGPVTLEATAPVTIVFNAVATLRVDATNNAAWLVSNQGGAGPLDDTPRVTVDVDVNGASPFTFPAGSSRIGILEVAVAGGSTLDLDMTLIGDFGDPNGDGVLAFQEVAEGGGGISFGEMFLPPSQLLLWTRQGSAQATASFTAPSFVSLSGPVSLSIPPTDLATGDPVTAMAGAAADLDELLSFQRLRAVDMLGGLTQFATLVRAAQTNPNAEVDLPLVDGTSADMVEIQRLLSDFVDARIVQVPPGGSADPTLADVPFTIDFASVQQLVTLIDGLNGALPKPTISYNATTDRLSFPINLKQDLPATYTPFSQPIPITNPPTEPKVGRPNFANEIGADTHILSVEPTSQPALQARIGWELNLPFIVDLVQASPDANDPTTSVEEFEDPMVYERFRTSAAGGDTFDITIWTALQSDLRAEGQIGFVPVTIGGDGAMASPYEFFLEGTSPNETPTVKIDIDDTKAGLGAEPRLGDLLKTLTNGTPTTDDDVVRPAPKSGKAKATLKVHGHGEELNQTLTPTPGTFTVPAASIGGPFTATADATADQLKLFDIDAAQPDELLGRFFDAAESVADGLDGALGALGAGNALSTELPLIGTSPRDLLNQGAALKATLDAARNGPMPVNLTDLENALESLYAAGSDINWSLKEVDSAGGTRPELVARIGVNFDKTSKQPVDISLGDPGNLVGIGATGQVDARLLGDLDVNLPISLEATPPATVKILNSSGFAFGGSVSDQAGNLQITGTLAIVNAQLGDSTRHNGRLDFGVQVSGYPGGTQIPEGAEVAQDFDAFATSLTPALNPLGQRTCASPDVNGSSDTPDAPAPVVGDFGCVSMPLFLNGLTGSGNDGSAPTPDDYLKIKVNNLASPEIVQPLPAFDFTQFDIGPMSFETLDDGLKSVKVLLDALVSATKFGASLPLVGDELGQASEMLAKIQQFVDNPAVIFGPSAPDARVDFVLNTVRQNLFNAIPGGILRESDYASVGAGYPADPDTATAGVDDIRVVMLCGGDKHLCIVTDNPGTEPNEIEPLSALQEVTFELELGQGARDVVGGDCNPGTAGSTPCSGEKTLNIDLGLDGLPLSVTGSLTAKAGWTIELGFGINRDGFFMLDSPVPGNGAIDTSAGNGDDEKDELRVGAGIEITSGVPITGEIGIFELTATDKTPVDPEASILMTTNLEAPGALQCESATTQKHCSGRITISDLTSGGLSNVAETPIFAAGIDIQIEITTGITGTGKYLPQIIADFSLCWRIPNDNQCGQPIGSVGQPLSSLAVPVKIEFSNLRLDVQKLFENTIGDLIKSIEPFLEPIEPIREFIFAPIPVISDLSRLFGGGDVTLVDIADKFGFVDKTLLNAINDVIELIQALSSAANAGTIPLDGVFGLDEERAAGPTLTPGEIDEIIPPEVKQLLGDLESIASDLAGYLPTGMKETVNEIMALGSGGNNTFELPLLNEPGCVFELLLGKDCAIVQWNPGPLKIDADYEQSFGPFFGVLYVTLGGYIHVEGHLTVGFSTRGIRMMAEGGVSDVGDVAQAVVQSIFFGDTHTGLPGDPNEIEVTAGIVAGGKISVIIAEAGVKGGLEANVWLNLHDGPELDGKLYIDEIIDKIHNPFCLFDIGGKLEAFLKVYAQFGICPFCEEVSHEIARVTLLEFASSCPTEKPELADVDGDVVILNVGTRAPLRKLEPDGNKAEAFVVRQIADKGGGKYAFSITFGGKTQTENPVTGEKYEGTTVRIIDAAGGDDSFLFQGTKAGGQNGQPVENPGDDESVAPFNAKVEVTTSLGDGNDSIITGEGNDSIADGGNGNDSINVGNGNTNTANGGNQDDTITGGKGVDTLSGGENNDTIDGGLEGDILKGNGGNDRIHGGRDLVRVPGQTPAAADTDKKDIIEGNAGNDTLDGGSGDDAIHGDDPLSDDSDGLTPAATSKDRISGGPGPDEIWAGNGDDLVFGGFAAGEQGTDQSVDKLHGNGGADTMYGSGGADEMFGGNGPDRLLGEGGADQIHGQGGNDPALDGGADADDMFGGPGDDFMTGGAGDDDMTGDSDSNPAVYGTDTMFGGDGADIILGDGGLVDDTTSPPARVPGPSETEGAVDHLFGDNGADQVYGEGGGDDVHGGSNDDLLHGNGGVDKLYGDNDHDEMWGDADNDELYGGPGDDVEFGNAGQDLIQGQAHDDLLIGGSPAFASDDTKDFLYGGTEDDRIYGDNVTIAKGANNEYDVLDVVTMEVNAAAGDFGDDVGDGGPREDLIHGQDGNDVLWGAGEHDQIFGELGDDQLHGEAGPDHLVGDRGTITPEADEVVVPPGDWQHGTPFGSPVLTVALVDPQNGGIDTIWGDFVDPNDNVNTPWATGGDDFMWGGAANDIMRGGSFDDYMEGNGGQDQMWGFDKDSDHALDGEDDMIGGSSTRNPDTTSPAGAPDTGEIEMQGNGQEDVMAGDNTSMIRVADPANPGAWLLDPVTGGVLRTVTLHDTEKTGAALDAVSGGDYMLGNDENDRMFGQGGNDLVKGNHDDDLVAGNQDGDWLEGNQDEDDIIGGSAFPDQPDTNDVLWGGGGSDVMAGDNACIVRNVPSVVFAPSSCPQLDNGAPADFHYVTSQIGVLTQRGVVFHDLDGPFADEFGADQLNGGEGVDVEFGQDGTDFLFGDGGDDFQHGNGMADVVVGDRSVGLYGTIDLPPEVGGVLPPLAPIPTAENGTPSVGVDLVGPPQADGQDDQLGGSNIVGHRDAGDWLFGDNQADFQLGDNGELTRFIVDGAYDVYEERYPGNVAPTDGSAVFVRQVDRYDVGTPLSEGKWGDDLIFGGNGTNPLISQGAGDGDDSQWGQDGNDKLFGEDGNDDQYGELGNDTMWGGAGEDAMVGDRGGIQTRFVEIDGSDPNDPDITTHESLGPPGINLGGPDSGPQDAVLKPFEAHTLYRGVSLSHDRDNSVLALGGNDAGGDDIMRGGPGHDSMHGADGADHVNGDSMGDYLYGDDGADRIWGGRGDPVVQTPDIPSRNNPGVNGEWIDVMFGGFGADDTAAGADIIDYQPRAGVDPALWFEMVKAYADTHPENAGVEGRQHHHGTDWQYGGWDRDVLQGDVAANGPNDGDKMLDWGGAYNLYTHCNAAYGGWNDVRKIDPNNLLGLERLAYVTGAASDFNGAPVLADVQTPGTSAYREVAIVYTKDLNKNTGKAFPATPGHFQDFICTSD